MSINRIKFNAVSAGTGSFVVASAVSGWLTPAAAGVTDGTLVQYVAQSRSDVTQWEYGVSTTSSSGTTVVRAPLRSSAGVATACNFTQAPIVAFGVLSESVVGITPQMFGAIADGVANDKAAIVAAFAVSTTSAIVFPPGTYLVDNSAGEIAVSNFAGTVSFLGGATILFTDLNHYGLVFTGGTGAVVTNVKVGYQTTPTSLTGKIPLEFDATTDTLITGCTIINSPGGGLKFDECIRPKATNINVLSSFSDGIGMYNCQDGEVSDVTIANTGDDGLSYVNFTAKANYDGGLASNIIVTNSFAAGIKIAGQSGVTICNFHIDGTASSGVHVQTDTGTRTPANVFISDGIIQNAGSVSPPAGNQWGVEIGSSTSVTIDNVNVLSATGIGIGGSGNDFIHVSSCYVTGNGSAAMELNSNGTLIVEDITSENSPVYAYAFTGNTRLVANNLTAINAFTSGAPNRPFYFVSNSLILADGIHLVDDQNPATGTRVYEATNTAGTLANITYQLPNGVFAFENLSAGIVGFVLHNAQNFQNQIDLTAYYTDTLRTKIGAITTEGLNSGDQLNITVSGTGNTVATSTGVTGQDSQVRSLHSRSSGKVHFEATFTTSTTYGGIGIASASHSMTIANGAGNDTTSIGFYKTPTGKLYFNNSPTSVLPAVAQGDVLAIEIDLGASLFWVMNITQVTPWNFNSSADPSTGVGGLSISGLTGSPWFIIVDLGGNGDVMTVNTGGSAFLQIPSFGFGNWYTA